MNGRKIKRIERDYLEEIYEGRLAIFIPASEVKNSKCKLLYELSNLRNPNFYKSLFPLSHKAGIYLHNKNNQHFYWADEATYEGKKINIKGLKLSNESL